MSDPRGAGYQVIRWGCECALFGCAFTRIAESTTSPKVPTPEWGSMLADSREFIRSNPWIVTLPGLAILVTVVSINLTGDGLRDALDPKMRRG